MADLTEAAGGGDGVRIQGLIDKPSVAFLRVDLDRGATIPPHRHRHEYVTIPLTDAKLVRVVHSGDKVVEEVPLELKAHEPYHVPPTKRGTSISIRNVGDAPAAWLKGIVRAPAAPRPTKPAPAKRAPVRRAAGKPAPSKTKRGGGGGGGTGGRAGGAAARKRGR